MPALSALRRRGGVPLLASYIVAVLFVDFALVSLRVGEDESVPTRAENFLPALWPEQWRDQLVATQARADEGAMTWRLHPEDTALNFARQVMQWSRVARLEACPPRDPTICPPGDGTRYAIARRASGPPLVVMLAQLGPTGERGIWSVVEVQGPHVFLDVEAGQTIQVGEDLVATTTLRRKIDGYLRTGSSYTVIPGGCGSGGGRVAKIENGTIPLRLSLDRVSCLSSDDGAFGAQISTGERLQSTAVGFIFVALDHDFDSIGYAMDASMPPEIRADFIGSRPILELAAVPVRFSPA